MNYFNAKKYRHVEKGYSRIQDPVWCRGYGQALCNIFIQRKT